MNFRNITKFPYFLLKHLTMIPFIFSSILTLVVFLISDLFPEIVLDPIVEISSGKIMGKILQGEKNYTFYAFQGIPYAKPPIGERRFEPPEKIDPWDGILDTRKNEKECIQTFEKSLTESEDCLYLSVYTPRLPFFKNLILPLPVLVFIHGGGFNIGNMSMQLYGPEFFMTQRIIVVTLQYRLGILGFLSTGDSALRGNNGLKDQQLALKWVQNNIQYFGGDKDKVTIFGQSSGSVSVGFHVLSESSRGLFRAAIQSSGSALGAWTIQNNPKELAYSVGKMVDNKINETTSTIELVRVLKRANLTVLKSAGHTLVGKNFFEMTYTLTDGNAFVGVVEEEHEGAFLTESPFFKLENGHFNHVPLMMGFVSEEGLFISDDPNLLNNTKERDKNNSMIVPSDMYIQNQTIMEFVGETIYNFYVKNTTFYNYPGAYVKLFSDEAFIRPTLKQVELQSKFVDIYLYEFSFMGRLGEEPNNRRYIKGADRVQHGEDLNYLFHSSSTKKLNTYPKRDTKTLLRMLTFWSNFVKYLHPTPEKNLLFDNIIWPKIESDTIYNYKYLLINDTLKIRKNYKIKMYSTLCDLYYKYAKKPFVTF